MLIGAALVPHLASATEFNYTLYSGILHSDNIDLSPVQPTSQNVFIPGLSFTLSQLGSTVQASVIGNLEYRDYLGRAFSNQTFTQAAGVVNWTLSPHRLDLNLADYAGVEPVASLAADTPANQQQTNVFVLGPTLHFRLGQVTSAQATLHYINTYAQKTPEFNSSRGDAELQLTQALSPTTQISANVSSQRVHFTNATGGPDYTDNAIYARYTNRLKQFDLDAIAGWSRLTFNGGAPSATDPLVRLTASYRPTVQSQLALTLQNLLTDAAQSMIIPADQIGNEIAATDSPVSAIGTMPGIATGSAVINSQTFLQRSVVGTYSYSAGRVTLSVSPYYSKFIYQNDATLNLTGPGISAGLAYRLRPLLTLSAYANGERLDYTNLQRRDMALNYGLSLVGRRTPNWSWSISIDHRQRSSTAAGQDYRENEIYFGLMFRR
ncbi:surface lipoprotein assembly modifier [Metallibacterium sp.]|uniref:surface lipoprotein assembly modifier n=1 Tax=Metallibacterium sp. TaxID=2940281 RepID=UPI00260AF109|nr:surface lipoprotein assembly modifier [Metallibacterium sp.]